VSQIYWDSMVFIYLLESHPQFVSKVERILKQIESRGDTLMTSVFTIGEVLTGPRRVGAAKLVDTIKAYFDTGRVALLPFNATTADHYSILRASLKVSQADGIHLATAALAGADAFVTNDRRLWTLQVPGIKFMVDLDGKVF
jgi:uncharacterized protein